MTRWVSIEKEFVWVVFKISNTCIYRYIISLLENPVLLNIVLIFIQSILLSVAVNLCSIYVQKLCTICTTAPAIFLY